MRIRQFVAPAHAPDVCHAGGGGQPNRGRQRPSTSAVLTQGQQANHGDKVNVILPGKNNLFVGGMREGEMSPTGQLQRIAFNDNWEELRREALLRELHQRIRDVRQEPDGLLYVIADEDQAALLRIEPL